MIETKYECIMHRMYYAPENYSQSDQVSVHAGGLKIMSIKAKYNPELTVIAMFNLKFSWK